MLEWELMHQMGITAQVCASGQWRLNHLVWTPQQCLPLSKCCGSHYLTWRWTDWPTAGTAAGPRPAHIPDPELQSHFLPSVQGIEDLVGLVAAFLRMIRIGWSCSPYVGDWSWVTDGLCSVSSACSSCITPEVLCTAIDNNCWNYHIQEESRLGGMEQIRKSLWIATGFLSLTRDTLGMLN